MKWFKHFTRAHEDRAIEKLIIEFGAVGYGLYFYCLEIIAGTIDADNITFELEPDAEILARRLSIDTLMVERIIKRCIELRLFEMAENGRITCLKISKFFDQNMTSNPHIRKLFARVNRDKITSGSQDNHKTVTVTCDQIRLDKIRLDDNNIRGPSDDVTRAKNFIKPTLEEVKAYCLKRSNGIDAEAFMAHYDSNGWKVGKSPMKSWTAAVITWEKQKANFRAPVTVTPVEVAIAERSKVPAPPSKCTCGALTACTNTRAMCKACGNTWDLAGNEWVTS